MMMPVPDACTLPTAERPLRLIELNNLLTGNVLRVERLDALHLRLTLAGGDATEAAARDLVARESQCCAFFEFAVTSAGENVLVDIGVPAAQRTVLDGLYARLSAAEVRS